MIFTCHAYSLTGYIALNVCLFIFLFSLHSCCAYRAWLCECFLSVSRIVAKSEKCDMYMRLDLHTELYPLKKNERFFMVLSPSLVFSTKVHIVLFTSVYFSLYMFQFLSCMNVIPFFPTSYSSCMYFFFLSN